MRIFLAGLLAAAYAFAQQSVPIYEDARVRIFNVPIAPHGDYIRVPLAGNNIRFSRGGVQTQGEITIELLQKQTKSP
ncbi:MAG: hypothetical protein LAO55_02475 [Acidobacteriia bacterium]|nr:hypothetical protein [Terriglobia bacterium]